MEALVRRCSVKKVFLENSQNSQENTCVRDFFNKVASLRPQACNFTKKEVFSCGFCEISKNTFFYRTRSVAASDFAIINGRLFLKFSKKR